MKTLFLATALASVACISAAQAGDDHHHRRGNVPITDGMSGKDLRARVGSHSLLKR